MSDIRIQKPHHNEPNEPDSEQTSQSSQQQSQSLSVNQDEPSNLKQTNVDLEYKDTKSTPKDKAAPTQNKHSDLLDTHSVPSVNGRCQSDTLESSKIINEANTTYKEEHRMVSSKEKSQAKPCPDRSYKTVFEKWSALQYEELRPSTKRQLSSESASKGMSLSKKSTVTSSSDEPVKPLLYNNLGMQPRKACLPISSSQRKPRRQLFSSTGVFLKVDTHAISRGREMKDQGVFSAQSIAQAITQGFKDDLEKIRAIWIWLCNNIEYDLEGYLGQSPKLCSPEDVIKTGRGVCSGFSSVFLEMCREVGIQCKEVSGYSKGIGHWPGHKLSDKPSDHMWNVVWVRGQWGLVDACWGAGTVNMENKTFVKRFDDFYFLTEPSEFINSHFPDDENWQLLDTTISLEQFESTPLKTSAYFTLELCLLQPSQYNTTTDNGEFKVFMSSCKPMTYAYELRQLDTETGAVGKSEVDSSCGLLSMTRQGLSLRLLPPEPGTYELKLFARPEGDSGTLLWVCSLELECPAVQKSQPLPTNPYNSWGLGARAEALGVKDCNVPGQDILEVGDDGQCEVVLQTSRPLMMVSEIAHSNLDSALAKRCLALQISEDKLVCHVLCPYKGFYRLSMFVRNYNDSSGSFQNVGNFLLGYKGPETDKMTLFPQDLGPWCGPGMRTQAAGMSNFSHTGALVNAPQGRCNITFNCASPELQIHAGLSANSCLTNQNNVTQPSFPLSRHILLTFTDRKVTVSVTIPGPGVYRLGLYGCTPPQQDYTPLCDYILQSVCDKHGDPFPLVYSAWGKGCVLLEPREGVLPPQSWVRFRVRVPLARKITVLTEQQIHLKINRSKVWEGEAFTGNVSQVKLTAAMSDSNDMSVLMTFDVLNLKSEPG